MSQLNKKPLESKKWIAMLIGVVCAMLVFLISVVAMAYCPQIADKVGSLANTVVVFLATMISVLITGQSAVDWKHSSNVNVTTSDERKESTEKRSLEIRQNNATVESFQEKYKSDDSYKPIEPETEMWK